MEKNNRPQSRRGAALIIALVLLAVIATVASIVLTQILRDRLEQRTGLIRRQTALLLDDALRNAEVRRAFDSQFFGETVTFVPDRQPFSGTFQVTTHYRDGNFIAEVEYHNEKGTLIRMTSQR
ncbi:MAG: hypothetical protein LBI05_07570 [Planctomycetaceae bacterium]|jgi:Tfp pilus assembly protein PilX|nr:hypothetical protein [Planctomycetaceae bacterium]